MVQTRDKTPKSLLSKEYQGLPSLTICYFIPQNNEWCQLIAPTLSLIPCPSIYIIASQFICLGTAKSFVIRPPTSKSTWVSTAATTSPPPPPKTPSSHTLIEVVAVLMDFSNATMADVMMIKNIYQSPQRKQHLLSWLVLWLMDWIVPLPTRHLNCVPTPVPTLLLSRLIIADDEHGLLIRHPPTRLPQRLIGQCMWADDEKEIFHGQMEKSSQEFSLRGFGWGHTEQEGRA